MGLLFWASSKAIKISAQPNNITSMTQQKDLPPGHCKVHVSQSNHTDLSERLPRVENPIAGSGSRSIKLLAILPTTSLWPHGGKATAEQTKQFSKPPGEKIKKTFKYLKSSRTWRSLVRNNYSTFPTIMNLRVLNTCCSLLNICISRAIK